MKDMADKKDILEKEKIDLQSKNTTLEGKNDTLHSANEALHSENDKLNDTNNHLMEQINDIFMISYTDDNYINRLIFQKLLESLKNDDYKLSLFENGIDLIANIKNNSFDIIILDIEMPEMNGFQVAKKIRETHPNQYIVCISGHKVEDNIFNDHVQKPLTLSSIKDIFVQFEKFKRKSELKGINYDLIDKDTIDVLKMLGKEELTNTMTICYEIVKDKIQEIINTLNNLNDNSNLNDNNTDFINKMKTVQQISHSQKGSSLQMGCKKIGELFTNIERNIRNKKYDINYYINIANEIRSTIEPTRLAIISYIDEIFQ